MSVPIDMDLGSPPRTIYEDIVNLPDPVKLGITARFHNYDDVDLYFKITGSHGSWTFGTVELGLVGTGASIQRNLDEFGSRDKPASEVEETIDFHLKAYTDAGYTNLKWEFHRSITIVFIKSDDPSYTQDVLNNFDDGTVQGWAGFDEEGNEGGYPTVAVATDFVLSAQYSLKMDSSVFAPRVRSRLYKQFTTHATHDTIYAILDIRNGASDSPYGKNVKFQLDDVISVFIGVPYNTSGVVNIPMDKWLRVVIPLPKNTTLDIRVVNEYYAGAMHLYLWLDDFKIISK